MKNSFYLFLFTLCLVSPSFVFDTAALGNPGQELLKETDSNGRIIGLDNIIDPSVAVGSTCVPQVNVRGLISDIEISEDNSVISGISFRTDEPGQRTHAHYNLSDKVRNSQEIRSFLTNGEPVSISYISTGASCRFLWVTSIRSIASTDGNRADAEPIIPFDPGIHQLYYYTSRGSSGLYSNDFISVGYYRQGDQVIGALSYNSPDSFCFAGVLNSNVINIEISNEPIENIPASIDLSQMIRPPGQSDSQYTGFIEYCSNEYLNGNIGTSPVTLTDPPSDPSSSSLLSTNVQDPTIKLCNQFGWKYYDHTNGCSNYNLSSDQPRSAIVNFHRCQDYNSTHQNPLTVCMQLFSAQGSVTNVFFIAQLGPEKEWSPKYFLGIADTSGVSCSLGGGSKREIQPQLPQDRNNDGLMDLVVDIQVDELCENSQETSGAFQLIFINNGNTFSPTQETLRSLTSSDNLGFEFEPSLPVTPTDPPSDASPQEQLVRFTIRADPAIVTPVHTEPAGRWDQSLGDYPPDFLIIFEEYLNNQTGDTREFHRRSCPPNHYGCQFYVILEQNKYYWVAAFDEDQVSTDDSMGGAQVFGTGQVIYTDFVEGVTLEIQPMRSGDRIEGYDVCKAWLDVHSPDWYIPAFKVTDIAQKFANELVTIASCSGFYSEITGAKGL